MLAFTHHQRERPVIMFIHQGLLEKKTRSDRNYMMNRMLFNESMLSAVEYNIEDCKGRDAKIIRTCPAVSRRT